MCGGVAGVGLLAGNYCGRITANEMPIVVSGDQSIVEALRQASGSCVRQER